MKSFNSLNRISENKAISSKLAEYETKIMRFELEAEAARKELDFLQQELSKSKRMLESKQDELERALEEKAAAEVLHGARMEESREAQQQLQEQKMMEVSEKEKLLMLRNDKIEFLEHQIADTLAYYEREKKEREDKFKAKIGEYASEISELKQAHEEEIAQLKSIYKVNTERTTESTQRNMNNNFFNDFSDQLAALEQLKQLNEQLQFDNLELRNNATVLQQKVDCLEERAREQGELSDKRIKDMEQHYSSLLSSQLAEKDAIILDLKDKVELSTRQLKEEENQLELQL
jgi:hypothetical protein